MFIHLRGRICQCPPSPGRDTHTQEWLTHPQSHFQLRMTWLNYTKGRITRLKRWLIFLNSNISNFPGGIPRRSQATVLPACPGSSWGPPTGWTCPERLIGEVSGRPPDWNDLIWLLSTRQSFSPCLSGRAQPKNHGLWFGGADSHPGRCKPIRVRLIAGNQARHPKLPENENHIAPPDFEARLSARPLLSSIPPGKICQIEKILTEFSWEKDVPTAI